MDRNYAKTLRFGPSFRGCGSRDLPPPLRRQFIAPRRATSPAHRLRSLVFAVVGSGVLLDLARQNLGDADRVGYSISGALLALWSFRHLPSPMRDAKHICDRSANSSRESPSHGYGKLRDCRDRTALSA